jgi:hypothetical protein
MRFKLLKNADGGTYLKAIGGGNLSELSKKDKTMAKIIKTKDNNRYVVQFTSGKTYSVLVEMVGNRLTAYCAYSGGGSTKVNTFNLNRHHKLLDSLTDAICEAES